MSVLTGSEAVKKGIVKGLSDPNLQAQPAGVDLTLDSLDAYVGQFEILKENFKPSRFKQIRSSGNIYALRKGAYRVTFQEILDIPPDVMGLVFPRSTLLRSGLTVLTAVWDPGYKGKGSAMLLVLNPMGAKLERGARIAQVVFMKLSSIPHKLYEGIYQFEGLEC